jgi:hypothetical protein
MIRADGHRMGATLVNPDDTRPEAQTLFQDALSQDSLTNNKVVHLAGYMVTVARTVTLIPQYKQE